MINNASSEQEADFEFHTTDCMGLEEESDHEESDVSCHEKVDTESLLLSDLRKRLVDRLRKRFNEEDTVLGDSVKLQAKRSQWRALMRGGVFADHLSW